LIMAPQDPYSSLLRQYFVSPVHAGALRGEYSLRLLAKVDDGSGTALQIEAGIDEGTLKELRFHALACPHLIAAAELFCERYEGRQIATLRDFRSIGIARELAIPVSKTGRILLLEDAVTLLLQETGNET